MTEAYLVGGVILDQSNLMLDIGVKSMTFVVFGGLLILNVTRSLGSTSLLRSAAMPLVGKLPILKLLFR